ncbi:hypothetical protein SSABA_v1c00840 [Spiroplasma sabaudiense Ar-1343]|uniref:Uncharacterized protein n=1 Tax=Spiroplasma sabaudiense Ar-1343 TaxID=1276257 RepID=W6A950_9MOLU|nr:hypothetical protein [Spiroplasma sabaudiense]AHI53496.1 hypothetical protein SSABA_v1c00840 [Spiroplasma sabaudiense Ar-1343]
MGDKFKIWIYSSIAAVFLAISVVLNVIFISKNLLLKDSLNQKENIFLTTITYDRDNNLLYEKTFVNVEAGSFYEITKTDNSFQYSDPGPFGVMLENVKNYEKASNEYFAITSSTHEKCAGKGYDQEKEPNACEVGASSLMVTKPETFVIKLMAF